jgi:hypothetical protein
VNPRRVGTRTEAIIVTGTPLGNLRDFHAARKTAIIAQVSLYRGTLRGPTRCLVSLDLSVRGLQFTEKDVRFVVPAGSDRAWSRLPGPLHSAYNDATYLVVELVNL